MPTFPYFVYLGPERFNVVGFAYGQAEGESRRRGNVKVRLIPSGRWTDEEGEQIEVPSEEAEAREVTEAEALNGVGTLVGSAVCLSRVPPGSPRIWDYGVVVGYRWDEESAKGRLDLLYANGSATETYEASNLQDLAVETYGLRSCAGRGVSALMPRQTRALHKQAYDHFNGTSGQAERSSRAILAALRNNPIDESLILPLFDVASSTIAYFPVHHILDFVFYKDGGRTPPTGVQLGDSIFQSVPDGDGQPINQAASQNPPSGDDLLSDSEDDSDSETAGEAPPPMGSAAKRRRLTPVEHSRTTAASRLEELRSRCAGDPDLQQDLDHLITLKRAGLMADHTARACATGGNNTNSQFQPYGNQSSVHQSLVNGAQRSFRLLSTPCCSARAIRLGLWCAGASVMHFARVTVRESRAAIARSDMTDFSTKNSVPTALTAGSFTAVMEAVDILTLAITYLYQPTVVQLMESAKRFLLSLRATDVPEGCEALEELVHWVDERLELFRFHIVEGNPQQSATVGHQFNLSHPSFARVSQLMLRYQVESAVKQAYQPTHISRPSAMGTRDISGTTRPRIDIPVKALRALPRQDGKAVCIRFLSAQGCRGRNGKCNFGKRAHFKPASLPPELRALIDANYGGITHDSSNGRCEGGQTSGRASRPVPEALTTFPTQKPGVIQVSTAKSHHGTPSDRCSPRMGCHSPSSGTTRVDEAPPASPRSDPHGGDAICSPVCGSLSAQRGGDVSCSPACGNPLAHCDGKRLDMGDVSHLSTFVGHQQAAFDATLRVHSRLADIQESIIAADLGVVLSRHGLAPPRVSPSSHTSESGVTHEIDREKQRVYSELIRRAGLQLSDFVRLLGGETSVDSRPNKSLHVPSMHSVWSSYQYREQWESIVANGDVNRYLILDIDLLSSLEGITYSPFGAVPKGDADLTVDARIIHDLSYPKGTSVNDNTQDSSEVSITYDGAATLAERIIDVAEVHPGKQSMMTGDVNAAFRRIPISADNVGRFAGTIPELGILVIDLCCPFGWSQSPSSYWVAGAAINHLYAGAHPQWSRQPRYARNPFDTKAWCDDHTCIEPDVGSRLAESTTALRTAMIAVLGHSACNGKKFTKWFQLGRALGLDWDLANLTVSMPPGKVVKAQRRIKDMENRVRTTRSRLNKLLGSLRHVMTCIRPATSFIQRLADLARSAPRFGTILLSTAARDGLRWFKLILDSNQLNSVPLSRFTHRREPDATIYMDASDRGLCAIFPRLQQ